MFEVNIHEAKTNLSRLLQRVAAGEEVTISKAGTPVARLVPVKINRKVRPLGIDCSGYTLPEDFNAPLPKDLLAAFAGERDEVSARHGNMAVESRRAGKIKRRGTRRSR